MTPFTWLNPIIVFQCLLIHNVHPTQLILSDFYRTWNCDYYSQETYSLSTSQIILNNITFSLQSYFEIHFSIQLNNYCNTSCTILSIRTDDNEFMEVISLSTINECMQTSVTTQECYQSVRRSPPIYSFKLVDACFHNVSFNQTSIGQTLRIDDITLLESDYGVSDMLYNASWFSLDKTYNLYINTPYSKEANGFISNICVKQGQSSQPVQINGEAVCGEQIIGDMSSIHDTYLYHLNVTDESTALLVTSCGSTTRISSIILYEHFAPLYRSYQNDSSICDSSESLFIHSLPSGQYILQFDVYFPIMSQWTVTVSCGDNATNMTSIHQLYIYYSIDDYYQTIYPSEILCEQQWGTTLATITTQQDINHAVSYIQRMQNIDMAFFTPYETVFIGMCRDRIHNGHWYWLDGTDCNYTTTGICMDIMMAWNNFTNDNEDNPTCWIFKVPNYWSNDTASVVEPVIGECAGTLCNAPNSKYKPNYCDNTLNCWHKMDRIDDIALVNDVAVDVESFLPLCVYWNSTIFLVGLNEIHYTHFELINTSFVWKHYPLDFMNSNFSNKMNKYQYAQYQSSIYLYVGAGYSETNDKVITMNLSDFHVVEYLVPSGWHACWFYDDNCCIVATNNRIYIIRSALLLIYDFYTDTWNAKPMYSDGSEYTGYAYSISCTMDNHYKMIYIFGFQGVIVQYNTEAMRYSLFKQHSEVFRSSSYVISAINDQIYVQGRYLIPWQTLIYNTQIFAYETETVQIDVPDVKDIPYYRQSQLTVFDDNILLLFLINDGKYPRHYDGIKSRQILLYFAITELISINFQFTSTNTVWPSDGLYLRYSVNDFTNWSLNTYYIQLNQIANNIDTTITLNSLHDDCICGFYKCHNCSYHFNITQHLSSNIKDVNQLTFRPTHHYNFSILLLPTEFKVELQRCNISLNVTKSTSNSINSFVIFKYLLSENCYSRIEEDYSLTIESVDLNISSKLIISIRNTTDHICKVCADDCYDCSPDDFTIYHGVDGVSNGEYLIHMQSDSINLRLITPSKATIFYNRKEMSHLTHTELYLLLLLSLPIVILVIFIYCRKQYMNAFVVDKVLVLIIGCSQFDDKKSFLPGVKRNIIDLKNLWSGFYNYDVFICNFETLHCTKQEIIEFVDQYKMKLDSMIHYRCIIVHLISHGFDDDAFLTSDHKMLELDFIRHELTDTAHHLGYSTLIKILVHHGCRGDANYSTDEQMSTPIIRNVFRSHGSINNKDLSNISHDANCITIFGNINGRTISDEGNFTQCICSAFRSNLNRMWKVDLNTLLVEIGRNLEQKTNGSEIINVSETLRYDVIRFVKQKNSQTQHMTNVELQTINTQKSENMQYLMMK
eukprot:57704_1